MKLTNRECKVNVVLHIAITFKQSARYSILNTLNIQYIKSLIFHTIP